MTEESPTLQEALVLALQGEGVLAERLVAEAALAAATRHGPESAEHAAALFELARVLVEVGDLVRAAEVLRRASELPPAAGRTPEAQRARLTCQMNLGEVLLRLGEADEAEAVLRSSLAERAALYGEAHPGYAHGLEGLAEVLHARGDEEEALELVERASAIFREDGPRLAAALALRALIAAELGKELVPGVEALGEPVLDELVRAVLAREQTEDARTLLPVLSALRAHLEARRGPADLWLLNLVGATANAARAAGQDELRRSSLAWLLHAVDARGDEPQGLEVTLGLALCESELGDHDAAERWYVEGRRRARRLGDLGLESAVLRNHGLARSENRPADAAPLLAEAVALAREAEDDDALGRALVALGIQRQHTGLAAEARVLFEEAIRRLPPEHPDTLFARSHLGALQEGSDACGCGDLGQAIAGALRDLVAPHLPDGLLREIVVALREEGPPEVSVDLAREPSAEERELLDRSLNQGLATLRGGLRRLGYSR